MPHTLLLADDSITIQRVIELTFADEDIKVVAVSDGDQAIASIEASPPDIVLADIGMPGRTGYEVAQYIKASPRLAHIPVVLLTGAFEPVDQAKAAEAGCDGVLAKPFEPQLVIQRVKELLSRPQLASLDANLAPPAKPPAPAADVDNYFDRLDAAFAKLSGAAVTAPVAAKVPAVEPANSGDAIDIDWFGQKPMTEIAPAPFEVTFAPEAPRPVAVLPTSVASAPVAAPAEPVAPPEPEPVAPPAPPALRALPPLADAFAALLTAEQGVGARAWRAGASPDAPAHAPVAPADLDALAGEVTRRVLDQLSDRVVHDTVADIVSKIAERLVREEIERVKNSIK